MTAGRPTRVVQFGQGVFLRGFVEWMIHRLNHEAGQDIGVALVQPRAGDEVARLVARGGRYPLLLRGVEAGGVRTEDLVIDCITGGVNTHDDPDGFVALARDPNVAVVVSNTTEAGIVYLAADGALGRDGRSRARSFPGKLTWFLLERYEALGERGRLFVLPCELIPDNGAVLHDLIRRLAADWRLGEGFDTWLAECVTFCDTLVDRIVPGRPADQDDPFAVMAEWYHALVIRGPLELFDVLPLDRLDFNVALTDDLAPHRELKVRTLNGTHTALTPVAYLSGCETVGEAVADPAIRAWITGVMSEEIVPTVDLPAPVREAFADAVLDRFANPFVEHRLLSISLNGTSKVRSRLLPVLRDLWSAGAVGERLADAMAAFLVFNRSRRAGSPIPVRDDAAALRAYSELWAEHEAARLDDAGLVRAVARHPDLFGAEGAWPAEFVAAVAARLPHWSSMAEAPGPRPNTEPNPLENR